MQMEKILEIIRSRGIEITDDSEVDKKDIKTLKDLLDAGINCLCSSHSRAAFIIAARIVFDSADIGKKYVDPIYSTEGIIFKTRNYITSQIETDHKNIGTTGVGFVDDPKGRRWFMPQIGGVDIGECCFIGSGVRICRGSIEDTIIGDRVQIAINSSIGHNCRIGAGT
ncbi:MAG: hypothetical protein ACXABD_22280, partial [Candidatus Thorarchaeota archaeon]